MPEKIDDKNKTLGEVLKAKRLSMQKEAKTPKEKKKYSLREMGKKIDRAHTYLYNLETNRRVNPSASMMLKLSTAYKMSYAEICELKLRTEQMEIKADTDGL